jgi:hypothetical protein
VIAGRGPGAPGVTPGPEFTGGRATAGGTGDQAVDLGEIRRSEEAINVLAARGAAGPDLTHDPALALLGALLADVDTPGTLAGRCADVLGALRHAHAPHIRPARHRHAQGRHTQGRHAQVRPAQVRPAQVRPAQVRHAPGWRAQAWPGRAADQRAEAWQALATPSRGAAAWLRAAVAGGAVAALASVTSLIATSMLARLTRTPVRGPARAPTRGAWSGQRPARARRMR